MSIPPPPPELPIAWDIPCLRCRYNLRTRLPSELCPQCGLPASVSLEAYEETARITWTPMTVAAALVLFPAAILLGAMLTTTIRVMHTYMPALYLIEALSHYAAVIGVLVAVMLYLR